MLLAANPAVSAGRRGACCCGRGRGGAGEGQGPSPSVSRNITESLAPFDLVTSTGYTGSVKLRGKWACVSVCVCVRVRVHVHVHVCVCLGTLPHIQIPIVLGCTEGPIPNPFCFSIS